MNSVNGVSAKSGRQNFIGESDVRKAIDAFKEYVDMVVGFCDESGVDRPPRFPGFALTDDIREKVVFAEGLMSRHKYSDALHEIEDARGHFDGKQGVFAVNYSRNCLRIWEEMRRANPSVPDEIALPMRKAIQALADVIGPPTNRFVLESAGVAAWQANYAIMLARQSYRWYNVGRAEASQKKDGSTRADKSSSSSLESTSKKPPVSMNLMGTPVSVLATAASSDNRGSRQG